MRVIIVSDSHGAPRKIDRVLQQQPTAEVLIHLGDGADDLEYARYEHPEVAFYQVCGNCDRCCPFPVEDTITLNGVKLLFTHGHAFRVKYTLEELDRHARQEKANVVLFGHTHRPETGYCDGLYWMNPGALKDNNYGMLDLVGHSIVTNLMKLK